MAFFTNRIHDGYQFVCSAFHAKFIRNRINCKHAHRRDGNHKVGDAGCFYVSDELVCIFQSDHAHVRRNGG